MKYNVIYADPPWNTKAGKPLGNYKIVNGKQIFSGNSNKSRNLAYPTMTLEEISFLNVRDISADNACLFLWVTNKYLLEAKAIIKAWGFKYSTTLVWAKNPMGGGLGGTFKITTEFLIFATKGNLSAKKNIIGTWFNLKRQYKNGVPYHSKKPNFFYELIEQVFDGNKIELFAREPREGWHTWGNELQNDIELK